MNHRIVIAIAGLLLASGNTGAFAGRIYINVESVSSGPADAENGFWNNLGAGSTITGLFTQEGTQAQTNVTHVFTGAEVTIMDGDASNPFLEEGLAESRVTLSNLRPKTWYEVHVLPVSLPGNEYVTINGKRVHLPVTGHATNSGASGTIVIETDSAQANLALVRIFGIMKGETPRPPVVWSERLGHQLLRQNRFRIDEIRERQKITSKFAKFWVVVGLRGGFDDFGCCDLRARWSRRKMKVQVFRDGSGANITGKVMAGTHIFDQYGQDLSVKGAGTGVLFRVKKERKSFRRSSIYVSSARWTGSARTRHQVTIIGK